MYRNENGFALAKVLIALVIIGLLLGGIFISKQMSQTSKIEQLVKETQELKAAFIQFQTLYETIPGDFENARSEISNCSPETYCQNGDGDNIIGSSGPDWLAKLDDDEALQIWKHLGLSKLIENVNPAYNADKNKSWGTSHPSSYVSGGYEIFYSNSDDIRLTGHFLRLSKDGLSENGKIQNPSAGLSPNLSKVLDTKMDDGKPLTGHMQVRSENQNTCYMNSSDENSAVYKDVPDKNCVLFFQLAF